MVFTPFAAYASKILTALSLLACITVARFVYLTVKESRRVSTESASVAPNLYKRILLAILINNACRIVIIWVFALFILASTGGESDFCKPTDQSNLCMARYMVVYFLKIAQHWLAVVFVVEIYSVLTKYPTSPLCCFQTCGTKARRCSYISFVSLSSFMHVLFLRLYVLGKKKPKWELYWLLPVSFFSCVVFASLTIRYVLARTSSSFVSLVQRPALLKMIGKMIVLPFTLILVDDLPFVKELLDLKTSFVQGLIYFFTSSYGIFMSSYIIFLYPELRKIIRRKLTCCSGHFTSADQSFLLAEENNGDTGLLEEHENSASAV